MSNKLEIWNCGGGTQSCAIGALIIEGKLPKPDLSLMVDTGREKSGTWEYFENVLKPALMKVGVEIHKVSKQEFATVDIYAHNGDMLLPVFTTQGGSMAKLPAFCSNEWKGRSADRWLRTQGVKANTYRKWIGFSVDEAPRVIKMRKSQGDDVRFPLVDLHMSRRDCIRIVEKMGWPTPPRSSCWMCPNMGDHEWREIIKNHPDDFQKAVELEREVRAKDPHAWFHKSCVPLDQVNFKEDEGLFVRACDSGNCFV